MKKLIVLFGLLVLAGGVGNAQTKGITVASWFQSEPVSLNRHKEFSTVGLTLAPGYQFNRSLFVRAQFDYLVGMWDRGDNDKTFRRNVTLGPSVGWNIVKNREWGILETTATVGNTLYNKDWSYIYYDWGLGWAVTPTDGKMKMLIGVGVRYNDSHNSRFNDYCSLYVKWGFRIN